MPHNLKLLTNKKLETAFTRVTYQYDIASVWVNSPETGRLYRVEKQKQYKNIGELGETTFVEAESIFKIYMDGFLLKGCEQIATIEDVITKLATLEKLSSQQII